MNQHHQPHAPRACRGMADTADTDGVTRPWTHRRFAAPSRTAQRPPLCTALVSRRSASV